ncbi:hypothetical protein L873DRAFT_1819036 [Choiromyces venosus 120613-1]|uniref:Uncharacterized protein n=1 Tax=Choiromyces venosus 120613-1 TaxID=1336337 RepID=A0A3N4J3F8_9PEZI|nr:hypothetical protein L873DRAFT_1819036 [Choiromyces venosus 120613-1]
MPNLRANLSIEMANQRAESAIEIPNLRAKLALERHRRSASEASHEQEWDWAPPLMSTSIESSRATRTMSEGLSSFTTSDEGGPVCQATIG